MNIRPYRSADHADRLRLRRTLWPDLLDENRNEDLKYRKTL